MQCHLSQPQTLSIDQQVGGNGGTYALKGDCLKQSSRWVNGDLFCLPCLHLSTFSCGL